MLFSIHQIEVHCSLPVKKLGAALVGEDHDAINHQIGRAGVWNDLHRGVTKGGVVGGKRRCHRTGAVFRRGGFVGPFRAVSGFCTLSRFLC